MLIRALDARDGYTASHSEQVSRLAGALARELGLDDAAVALVRLAGRVHDLGYLSLSDVILMKPPPLSGEEQQLVRAHPLLAAQLLDALGFPLAVRRAVRHHEERLDGSGYPDGLVGAEIPRFASILAVADILATLTSPRPPRAASSTQDALAELAAKAGDKYDAEVVRALQRLSERGLM
jgi:putative nucleotidyltransferase with HDIG domain